MTRLILDPCSLPSLLPKASVSQVYKIRLIVQVVEYDGERVCLVVRQMPITGQVTAPSRATVRIRVSEIISSLNPEMIHYGSIVSITAFYDGVDVTAVECNAINVNNMQPQENIATLVGMTELESFD
jgi:ribosomal protein L2